MRLVRIRLDAGNRLGVVVGGEIRLLGAPMSEGVDHDVARLAAIPELLAAARRLSSVSFGTGERVPLSGATLLSPLVRPGKIVVVGHDHRDSRATAPATTPAVPVISAKFATAIVDSDGAVRIDPDLSTAVEGEPELAVVIGMRARHIAPRQAMAHVLGYTCANDVSARDLSATDGQWVRSKSLDTFCPLGPWVVTTDDVPAASGLRLRLIVSGEVVRDGSTADMILTGAPPRVAAARQLRPVDEVVVEIDGVGTLRNPVVAA